MSIVLVGINHKTAPVAVRETLAFSDEACAAGLRKLVDGELVREGLIVSTCNRVEVLVETDHAQSNESAERIAGFLGDARNIPHEAYTKHLYTHTNDEAVRHIFRVASSLDSMVVGEAQVLGQVRRAYSLAVEAGTAGRVLNRLVHHAFRVAKRIRTETGIATNAVSISYMAVELGRKIFGKLNDRSVLLIGAGEMAELAARHLVNAGVARIMVANRTPESARKLADEFHGETVDYETLADSLHRADIVICSTAASEYVMTPALVQGAIENRKNGPAVFIDISVPRNVDPAIADLRNVFVFDVDDLESVIASNIREREREAERAELIVESEVMRFQQALRGLDIGPQIGALRQRMHDIARGELGHHRHRLGQLTAEQESAIEALLISTVNKISHPMINRIRRSYDTGDVENIRDWQGEFGIENIRDDD